MSDSTSDSKSCGKHPKPGHKRLTPEQVKRHWKLGDYTASGYLIHLLGALKRDGWVIDIPNVTEFCQKWEIGERRFYRAKAKLIAQGRLGERIKGRLKLWIITDKVVPFVDEAEDAEELDEAEDFGADSSDSLPDKTVSPPDKTVSLSDKSVSPPDSGDSDTPSEALPDARSLDSPDLSQISFRSPSDLSHSHPPHPGEREPDGILIDGQPIEPYRTWLRKRAEALPQRPALIDKWIAKQAQDPINQEAFLKYQQRSVGANLPLPVSETHFESPKQEELTPRERLERYQQMWKVRQCRKSVHAAIQAHPEWGLEIGKEGPQFVDESDRGDEPS